MLSDYTFKSLSPSIAFQPASASISQQGPHLASSTLVSTGLQPVRVRRVVEWQPAPGFLYRTDQGFQEAGSEKILGASFFGPGPAHVQGNQHGSHDLEIVS